ncbi:hypothetical protein MLD38_020115 [Melastoma candidum]|uniref:Uncharacterized protein n=1 Tax=Melastoma candidum TaxID=119954 RepID=A0ACB9QCF2_9MYRT|nr:hypothetical protein MLD38_020115 [Melastoma candidum]
MEREREREILDLHGDEMSGRNQIRSREQDKQHKKTKKTRRDCDMNMILGERTGGGRKEPMTGQECGGDQSLLYDVVVCSDVHVRGMGKEFIHGIYFLRDEQNKSDLISGW